jgi:hypothetical protein
VVLIQGFPYLVETCYLVSLRIENVSEKKPKQLSNKKDQLLCATQRPQRFTNEEKKKKGVKDIPTLAFI